MSTKNRPNGHNAISPETDERYKAINRTLKRFKYEKDALLEVLNAAQESFGFLSEELLQYVADQLHVPMSRVYGVATFYNQFRFEPLGRFHIPVTSPTGSGRAATSSSSTGVPPALLVTSNQGWPIFFWSR